MFSRNVFRILFQDLKKKNCSQKQMYSLCFSDLFSVFLRRVTGVLLAETRVLFVFLAEKDGVLCVFHIYPCLS